MTTFQDPPIHSRRAARQGERNAAYGQQPEQPAEPLTYSTQARPPLPQYDGPDFQAQRTPEAPTGEPEQPATQRLPQQDVPTYRPRDYSPEGRRSHAAPVSPPAAPQQMPEQVAPQPAPEPVAPPVAVSQPVATPAAVQPETPVEHTLTRRELRALREARGQQVDAPPAPEPEAVVSPPALVEPASAPAEEAAAPVEAEPVAPAAESVTPAAEAAPAPTLSPFEALFAPPSQQSPAPVPSQRPLVDPIVAAEPVASEPEAVVAEPVEVAEPAAAEPTPILPAPIAPAPSATPRSGHWSAPADVDDANQANESTITRSVGAGSGAITTSALVLPSLPNADYAHLGTGEILVTGSIDLPHSLATSGAHPTQLDEHHLDHELDPGDHQVVSTDSQPVRAVKAISSHTSTRNVIVAKKPVGNRALTALIISAAGMAAVVVTLLVVGLVTRVL